MTQPDHASAVPGVLAQMDRHAERIRLAMIGAAMVEGLQLNGVREGSPAAKAGLKAGDIIIKFGDRVVKNVQDYTFALQDHKPGDKVEIVVKRGDQTLTLTATLEARRQ